MYDFCTLIDLIDKLFMTLKLIHILGSMGLLGVFTGLYHLVYGDYAVMSFCAVLVSTLLIILAIIDVARQSRGRL